MSFTENIDMDILLKDEPLDLDFDLQEEFKSSDPKNNASIGEIAALVKEVQVFLQESEYEMKNMQNCFEKMKRRHTENIMIVSRVLQMLTTYNVTPVAIDQGSVANKFVNPSLGNIDNERSPNTIFVEQACTTAQTDETKMEFSMSERPSNYTPKEDIYERSDNNQKKITHKSLSDKGQATKHSLLERPSNCTPKEDIYERSESKKKKIAHKRLSDKGQATKHSLLKKIQNELPFLTKEVVNSVVEKLMECGVENESDLKYVEEGELSEILKPIHIRKLLKSWKITVAEKASSSNRSLTVETECSSKQTEIEYEKPCFSINDPNWVFKFHIPWDLMPRALLNNIKKSERPSAQLRRQMVRIIVTHIHKKCKNPLKKHMNVIAMKIVKQYPMSFQDRIGEMIVGSGWDSLQRQLTLRSENVNRTIQHTKRKFSSALSDSTNMRCNYVRNGYGCVNWQPEEPDWDDSNAVVFYEQRSLINSRTPLPEIKHKYPNLFEKEGLLSHFKNLVDIDLIQSFEFGFSTKGPRIYSFMKNCSIDCIKLLIKELKKLEMENDYSLDVNPSVIINLLEVYFKEEGFLFRFVEETTLENEILTEELPKTPCLIVCGTSIHTCKRYMLTIDQEVQIDGIEDFGSAFAILFATFYVFNIEYPEGARSVLEFIQRGIVGINPGRGMKVERKKNRKCHIIYPKVLQFINKLANFEWSDEED